MCVCVCICREIERQEEIFERYIRDSTIFFSFETLTHTRTGKRTSVPSHGDLRQSLTRVLRILQVVSREGTENCEKSRRERQDVDAAYASFGIVGDTAARGDLFA